MTQEDFLWIYSLIGSVGAVVFPWTCLGGAACALKQESWCGNKSFSDLPQKVAFSSQANTLARWTACSCDAGARVSCLKVIKTLGLSIYLWKKNPRGRCFSALLLTCAMRVNLPESCLRHRWRRKQLGWLYEMYLYADMFTVGLWGTCLASSCRLRNTWVYIFLSSDSYAHMWAGPNSIKSLYLGIQIPHRGFYGVLFPF